jgi:hypothetical protein
MFVFVVFGDFFIGDGARGPPLEDKKSRTSNIQNSVLYPLLTCPAMEAYFSKVLGIHQCSKKFIRNASLSNEIPSVFKRNHTFSLKFH